MIKLIVFDLDNTLSEPRQKISSLMANSLRGLLERKEIGIISGGTADRIEIQVISELPKGTFMDNLILLPQSGTQCFYIKNGIKKKIYEYDLTSDEEKLVYSAIDKVSEINKPEISFPPLVEDKGGQITYSPVGINAPLEIKKAYDPDHHKRQEIVPKLEKLLPGFEIGIGGSSSIDITEKGMNKSFGIKKILKLKNLSPQEVIFIGDALFSDGNDAPVQSTGVRCVQVKDPAETIQVIEKILHEDEES